MEVAFGSISLNPMAEGFVFFNDVNIFIDKVEMLFLIQGTESVHPNAEPLVHM